MTLNIDFSPIRQPVPIRSLLLFAGAIVCLSVIVLKTLYIFEQEQHAIRHLTKPTLNRPPERIALSPVQTDAINRAIRQLNLPWESLFAEIEACVNSQIELLALEPDASNRMLRIHAEAKSADGMLDFVGSLEKSGFILSASRGRRNRSESTITLYCGGAMGHRLNISFLLQWQLLIRWLNFWHLSALLLCLAAVILQWLVLPAIEQHVNTLNDQLRNIAPQDSVTTSVTLTEERLQVFRDRLADDNERTEVLQKVFAEAEKANIVLQQGDYVLLLESESNFSKIQISLPLKGSYAQIRIYAKTLLETIPALSLDEIGFWRASVNTPNVEAKLHLTLYMKGQDVP